VVVDVDAVVKGVAATVLLQVGGSVKDVVAPMESASNRRHAFNFNDGLFMANGCSI